MKKGPQIPFSMQIDGLTFFKDEDTAWSEEEDLGWLCDCFHRVEGSHRDDEAPWDVAEARARRLIDFLMAMDGLGVQVTELTFKQRPHWLQGFRKGRTR